MLEDRRVMFPCQACTTADKPAYLAKYNQNTQGMQVYVHFQNS